MLAFYLFQHGRRWVLDFSPLAGSNAKPNLLRALAKIANRLGSLDISGDMLMFDGNEFDQSTGFWLQQAAAGLERLAQANNLNLLTQQVKLKTIQFHEVKPNQESAFYTSQQELTQVLHQLAGQKPSANPQLAAQKPPSNPQLATQQKQGGTQMNNNISLGKNDSGHRHIYQFYAFDANTDEIVEQGSIVVNGKTEEEAKQNLTNKIKDKLGSRLNDNMYLHVRWVTSFEKPKPDNDSTAKLAEAIRAVVKETK